jgi:hypothetical protein
MEIVWNQFNFAKLVEIWDQGVQKNPLIWKFSLGNFIENYNGFFHAHYDGLIGRFDGVSESRSGLKFYDFLE